MVGAVHATDRRDAGCDRGVAAAFVSNTCPRAPSFALVTRRPSRSTLVRRLPRGSVRAYAWGSTAAVLWRWGAGYRGPSNRLERLARAALDLAGVATVELITPTG